MTRITPSDVFDRVPLVAAGLLPLLGHAITIGLAWLVGQAIGVTPGAGFTDLAAVVVVFIVGQAVLAVVCVTAIVYYLSLNRRPLGLAVTGGWFLGMFIIAILLGSSGP